MKVSDRLLSIDSILIHLSKPLAIACRYFSSGHLLFAIVYDLFPIYISYCMQIFFFRSSFVCYRLWLVSYIYIYIYISYLWLIQFIWFIYKFFKFLLIVRYKYTFIELSNFTSFFIWGREGGGRRIYLWTQVPKSCSFGTLKQ